MWGLWIMGLRLGLAAKDLEVKHKPSKLKTTKQENHEPLKRLRTAAENPEPPTS